LFHAFVKSAAGRRFARLAALPTQKKKQPLERIKLPHPQERIKEREKNKQRKVGNNNNELVVLYCVNYYKLKFMNNFNII